MDRPPRWSDLQRHLHFATAHDLQDIISYDWPAAKGALAPHYMELTTPSLWRLKT